MNKEKYQFGIIGLGVMGQNLALNLGDNGFSVVGYDKNNSTVQEFNDNVNDYPILGVNHLEKFINSLETPRIIMMMVPAGPPVDHVIRDLFDLVDPGDMIIDGGNSHFSDTELREKLLQSADIEYLGVGISGGEVGARHGPSIMPGGSFQAYQRAKPFFEAIAAQVEGSACVTYLGTRGAGHYVKMVHNGIEYGLMQLIAETYDLMKRGLNLKDQQISEIYHKWNQMELNSYLIEITANIFSETSQNNSTPLVEEILDEADQKGTGRWTSKNAMDLQIPVPNIDAGVGMRNLSLLKDEREVASQMFAFNRPEIQTAQDHFLDAIRMGLYAAEIITFSQGFHLLKAASERYDYQLDLASIAKIWRGGCIIRTSLLNEIRAAYRAQPDLPNLLLDPDIGEDIQRLRTSLAETVKTGVELGIPTSGHMAALSYLDAFRSSWLPANLIQAQRDYFGDHKFERVDKRGTYHHDWIAQK